MTRLWQGWLRGRAPRRDGGRPESLRAARPLKDGPWWVDLSCAGSNDVEFIQALPEAAGADVETIVRQSTDDGLTWRRLAEVVNGAANETAPLPVDAVAVGARGVCLLSSPQRTTLDIDCTDNGGRSFRRARTPRMPSSRFPEVHLQGVNFLGEALGWLEVVDVLAGGRQPPRYQTEIWATADGGASWRVGYASSIRRVPPAP